MSLKFGKNRSVSIGYSKIPLYYTGIKHPNNSNKELVVIDRIGDNYIICWKNMLLNKIGVEQLAKATTNGFIFKDKEINLSSCSKVW